MAINMYFGCVFYLCRGKTSTDYIDLAWESNKTFRVYRNNSIYWDPVCIGTPFVLEKIIILTIILIETY